MKTTSKDIETAIHPLVVLRCAAFMSSLLVFAHIVLWFLYEIVGMHKIVFLRELFDLELEVSIPTWYAQMQLLGCSLMALVITLWFRKTKSRSMSVWMMVFAGLLLFLSIDEGAGIHEQLIHIIGHTTNSLGYVINPWIPYGLVSVVIGVLLYVKLYVHLPSRQKVLLIMAAILFVSGAFVVDMVSGSYADMVVLHKFVFVPLEEGLELVGVSVLIYALVDYAKKLGIKLRLIF